VRSSDVLADLLIQAPGLPAGLLFETETAATKVASASTAAIVAGGHAPPRARLVDTQRKEVISHTVSSAAGSSAAAAGKDGGSEDLASVTAVPKAAPMSSAWLVQYVLLTSHSLCLFPQYGCLSLSEGNLFYYNSHPPVICFLLWR
jgi:hypothetical protein